jgi:hypothetical protein
MITTAAGLLVAIPTVLAYHAIAAKVERLVFEMDAMTIEFVEQYASASWRNLKLPVAAAPSAARIEELDSKSSRSDGRGAAVAVVA